MSKLTMRNNLLSLFKSQNTCKEEWNSLSLNTTNWEVYGDVKVDSKTGFLTFFRDANDKVSLGDVGGIAWYKMNRNGLNGIKVTFTPLITMDLNYYGNVKYPQGFALVFTANQIYHAIGNKRSGLGYDGIENAVAFEWDFIQNADKNDVRDVHFSVHSNLNGKISSASPANCNVLCNVKLSNFYDPQKLSYQKTIEYSLEIYGGKLFLYENGSVMPSLNGVKFTLLDELMENSQVYFGVSAAMNLYKAVSIQNLKLYRIDGSDKPVIKIPSMRESYPAGSSIDVNYYMNSGCGLPLKIFQSEAQQYLNMLVNDNYWIDKISYSFDPKSYSMLLKVRNLNQAGKMLFSPSWNNVNGVDLEVSIIPGEVTKYDICDPPYDPVTNILQLESTPVNIFTFTICSTDQFKNPKASSYTSDDQIVKIEYPNLVPAESNVIVTPNGEKSMFFITVPLTGLGVYKIYNQGFFNGVKKSFEIKMGSAASSFSSAQISNYFENKNAKVEKAVILNLFLKDNYGNFMNNYDLTALNCTISGSSIEHHFSGGLKVINFTFPGDTIPFINDYPAISYIPTGPGQYTFKPRIRCSGDRYPTDISCELCTFFVSTSVTDTSRFLIFSDFRENYFFSNKANPLLISLDEGKNRKLTTIKFVDTSGMETPVTGLNSSALTAYLKLNTDKVATVTPVFNPVGVVDLFIDIGKNREILFSPLNFYYLFFGINDANFKMTEIAVPVQFVYKDDYMNNVNTLNNVDAPSNFIANYIPGTFKLRASSEQLLFRILARNANSELTLGASVDKAKVKLVIKDNLDKEVSTPFIVVKNGIFTYVSASITTTGKFNVEVLYDGKKLESVPLQIIPRPEVSDLSFISSDALIQKIEDNTITLKDADVSSSVTFQMTMVDAFLNKIDDDYLAVFNSISIVTSGTVSVQPLMSGTLAIIFNDKTPGLSSVLLTLGNGKSYRIKINKTSTKVDATLSQSEIMKSSIVGLPISAKITLNDKYGNNLCDILSNNSTNLLENVKSDLNVYLLGPGNSIINLSFESSTSGSFIYTADSKLTTNSGEYSLNVFYKNVPISCSLCWVNLVADKLDLSATTVFIVGYKSEYRLYTDSRYGLVSTKEKDFTIFLVFKDKFGNEIVNVNSGYNLALTSEETKTTSINLCRLSQDNKKRQYFSVCSGDDQVIYLLSKGKFMIKVDNLSFKVFISDSTTEAVDTAVTPSSTNSYLRNENSQVLGYVDSPARLVVDFRSNNYLRFSELNVEKVSIVPSTNITDFSFNFFYGPTAGLVTGFISSSQPLTTTFNILYDGNVILSNIKLTIRAGNAAKLDYIEGSDLALNAGKYYFLKLSDISGNICSNNVANTMLISSIINVSNPHEGSEVTVNSYNAVTGVISVKTRSSIVGDLQFESVIGGFSRKVTAIKNSFNPDKSFVFAESDNDVTVNSNMTLYIQPMDKERNYLTADDLNLDDFSMMVTVTRGAETKYLTTINASKATLPYFTYSFTQPGDYLFVPMYKSESLPCTSCRKIVLPQAISIANTKLKVRSASAWNDKTETMVYTMYQNTYPVFQLTFRDSTGFPVTADLSQISISLILDIGQDVVLDTKNFQTSTNGVIVYLSEFGRSTYLSLSKMTKFKLKVNDNNQNKIEFTNFYVLTSDKGNSVTTSCSNDAVPTFYSNSAISFKAGSEALIDFSLKGCAAQEAKISDNPADFTLNVTNSAITSKVIPAEANGKYLLILTSKTKTKNPESVRLNYLNSEFSDDLPFTVTADYSISRYSLSVVGSYTSADLHGYFYITAFDNYNNVITRDNTMFFANDIFVNLVNSSGKRLPYKVSFSPGQNSFQAQFPILSWDTITITSKYSASPLIISVSPSDDLSNSVATATSSSDLTYEVKFTLRDEKYKTYTNNDLILSNVFSFKYFTFNTLTGEEFMGDLTDLKFKEGDISTLVVTLPSDLPVYHYTSILPMHKKIKTVVCKGCLKKSINSKLIYGFQTDVGNNHYFGWNTNIVASINTAREKLLVIYEAFSSVNFSLDSFQIGSVSKKFGDSYFFLVGMDTLDKNKQNISGNTKLKLADFDFNLNFDSSNTGSSNEPDVSFCRVYSRRTLKFVAGNKANIYVELRDKENVLTNKKADITLSASDIKYNVVKSSFSGFYLVEILTETLPQSISFRVKVNNREIPMTIGLNVRAAFPVNLDVHSQKIVNWNTVQYTVASEDSFKNLVCDSRLSLVPKSGASLIKSDIFYDSEAAACRVLFYFSGYAVLTSPLFKDNTVMKLENLESIRVSNFASSIILDQNNSQTNSPIVLTLKLISSSGYAFPSDTSKNGMSLKVYSVTGYTSKILVKEISPLSNMISSFTVEDLGIINGDYLISAIVDGNELQVMAPFRSFKSNIQVVSSLGINLRTGNEWSALKQIYDPSVKSYQTISLPYPFTMLLNFVNKYDTKISVPNNCTITATFYTQGETANSILSLETIRNSETTYLISIPKDKFETFIHLPKGVYTLNIKATYNGLSEVSKNIYMKVVRGVLQKNDINVGYSLPGSQAVLSNPLDIIGIDNERTINTNVGSYSRTNLCLVSNGTVYNEYLSPELFEVSGLDANCDLYKTISLRGCIEFSVKCSNPSNGYQLNVKYNKMSISQTMNILIDPELPPAKVEIIQPFPLNAQQKTGVSMMFNLLDSKNNKFQYVNYDNFDVYLNNVKMDNFKWQVYFNQNLTLNLLSLDYPPRSQNIQVMFKDSNGGYIRLDNLTSTISVSQGALDPKRTTISQPASYYAGDTFSFITIIKDTYGNCLEDNLDLTKFSGKLSLSPSELTDFTITQEEINFPICKKYLKFVSSTPIVYRGKYKLEVIYSNNTIATSSVNVLPNVISPAKSLFIVSGYGTSSVVQVKAGVGIEIQMTGTDAYTNPVSYYNIAEKFNLTIDGLTPGKDYFFSSKIDDNQSKVLLYLTINTLGRYKLTYTLDNKVFVNENGLKEVIVTPGKCSVVMPMITYSSLKLYSGDYGDLFVNCLDQYGNKLTVQDDEKFDVIIRGRNLEIVKEDSIPYDITFNTGTYNIRFLLAYQGLYDVNVFLNGKNYGQTITLTVMPQKCPPETPVMCSTKNCAAKISDCTTDTDSYNCPDASTPFKCKIGGLTTCVAKVTECDCSSGFSKCNGNCLPVNATDICMNPITSNCQRKLGSNNVIPCADGSCRTSNSRCPNPLGCPLGYKPCGVGCINRNNTCTVVAPNCKPNQVKCWDLSCADSIDSCPTGKTCSDKDAFVCPDGKCVMDSNQCSQPPNCISPFSFLCPDFTCKKSASDCSSRPVCGLGQSLCENNVCAFTCPKTESCPLDKYLCSTGQCVSNILLCPTPISCPKGSIKCPSGSCALNPEECKFVSGSNSLTCPLQAPILCPDLSCVTELSQCKSLPRCPPEAPFRCPNNECRRSASGCPSLPVCPEEYPVLCSDGTCQKASYHCSSNKEGNVCTKVRCSDGSCVNSISLCPSQVSCGPDKYKCWDGACVSNVKECRDPKYIECPSNMPYRCSDGSCRLDKSSCSTISVCPKEKPVKCYDLSCKESINLCPPYQNCGKNMFSCPDGTCSSQGCNTIVTCPLSMPFLCSDNTCKADIRDCPQSPDCNNGVLCPDGTCMPNRQLCKFFDPCPPLNPIRCQQGSCAKTVDECYSVIRECPIGFVKCPNGGCKMNAALCEPFKCPINLPHLCPEGSCVENAEQCDSPSGCPFNQPHKCIDGTCVVGPLDCNKYLNVTCSKGFTVCPDGSCAKNFEADCPLANGCPKEKPQKCANGMCIDSTISSCSPSICPFESPIKCASGECVATSANCPISVREQDYAACDAIGLPGNYMCADGKCLPSPDLCRPLYTCSLGLTRCSDGTCKLFSSLCPNSSNCPTNRPYRCSSGRCVENQSQCYSNILCPPEFPTRCEKTGECVFNSTLSCPGVEMTTNGCPENSPVKCSDGRCMTNADLCLSVNLACSPDFPILCADGTCKNTVEDCQGIKDACQEGYERCPDGTCAEASTLWLSCKNKIGCPLVSPIRCSDGSCAADTKKCPTVISCNSAAPVLCADKSCVTDAKFCNVLYPCPKNSPFRCPNGYCAADSEACSSTSQLCPLSSPVKCPTGRCVQSIIECSWEYNVPACKDNEFFCAATSSCVSSQASCIGLLNASGSKNGPSSRLLQNQAVTKENGCHSATPYSCYDGTCRVKQEDCPLLPACNILEYRCPNGSCQKDQSKCKENAVVCENGLNKCEDGLCRKVCPAYNGCGLSDPFQCTNGMCVKNLLECIGYSMCNPSSPFRCIDGSCVADANTCPNIRRLNSAQKMQVSLSALSAVNVNFAFDRYKHSIGSLYIPANSLQGKNQTSSNYSTISIDEIAHSKLYKVNYNFSEFSNFNISNGIVGSEGYLDFENSVLSAVVTISGENFENDFGIAGRISLEHNYYLNGVFLTSDYCLAKLIDSKEWVCVDRKKVDEQIVFSLTSFGTYAVVLNPLRYEVKLDPSYATSFFFDNLRTISIVLGVLFVLSITIFYIFTRVLRYREKYKESKEKMINQKQQFEDYRNITTDAPGQTARDTLQGIVFTTNPARSVNNVTKGSTFDLENEIEEIQNKCKNIEKQNKVMENKVQNMQEKYKELKMEIDTLKSAHS